MARKSRKNPEKNKIIQRELAEVTTEKIKLGGYVRLSKDDGDNDSIETQILMIRQYVADHDEFELVDIYSDDGVTGTSFDRPDFNRLIQDARLGIVQCIIVKDLSRFGRNYVEAGYYIETILPRLKVRLISINDRFDSSRPEDQNGIELPIKNMINAMYALDTSRKIVKGFEAKSSAGETKYRTTTYGYFIDDTGKSLVVDPYAARYVKLIFKWYLMGVPARQIAERLNFMEVEIPSRYKEHFSNRISTAKRDTWSGSVVHTILKNCTYAGDKVNGKQRTRLESKEDHVQIPRESWIVHDNYHEPLIGREDFDTVQKILLEKNEKIRQYRDDLAEERNRYGNVFSHKVICAECGQTMSYLRKNKGGSRTGIQEALYICSKWAERDNACGRTVPEDYLKMIVLDQIKILIQFLAGKKALAKKMRSGEIEKSQLVSLEKKRLYLMRKVKETEDQLVELYKNLTDELLNEEEYRIISKKYSDSRQEYEARIKKLDEELYQKKRWIDRFEELCDNMESIQSDDTDVNKLMNDIVEKIYVEPDNSIKIVFACEDVIERFNSLLEDDAS